MRTSRFCSFVLMMCLAPVGVLMSEEMSANGNITTEDIRAITESVDAQRALCHQGSIFDAGLIKGLEQKEVCAALQGEVSHCVEYYSKGSRHLSCEMRALGSPIIALTFQQKDKTFVLKAVRRVLS